MTREELVAQIKKKASFLCVGLDTDIEKLPNHLPKDASGVIAFNKAIIEATKDLAVAYKLNTAFYETLGASGWNAMEETLKCIPNNIFTIADAKRGDIGNTGDMYAKAFLEKLNFDSITVAPYMGEDSVKPFLNYSGKWTILLGLTSNPGSKDFQQLACGDTPLFGHVAQKAQAWGNEKQLMFVVGATNGEAIGTFRKYAPSSFLLVPGVGKQGGSLEDVVNYGMIQDCGLLVNSSRGIIYASQGADFKEAAAERAKELQQEMHNFLKKHNLV